MNKLKNTVWGSLDVNINLEDKHSEIEKLFCAAAPKSKEQKSTFVIFILFISHLPFSADLPAAKAAAVTLLDHKKANNIGTIKIMILLF